MEGFLLVWKRKQPKANSSQEAALTREGFLEENPLQVF